MNVYDDWFLTFFMLTIFCTLPMVLLGIDGLDGAPEWLWIVQAGVLLAWGMAIIIQLRSTRIRSVWKCILTVLSFPVATFFSNYICIEICLRRL